MRITTTVLICACSMALLACVGVNTSDEHHPERLENTTVTSTAHGVSVSSADLTLSQQTGELSDVNLWTTAGTSLHLPSVSEPFKADTHSSVIGTEGPTTDDIVLSCDICFLYDDGTLVCYGCKIVAIQ